MTIAVECRSLSKSYGREMAVDNINLSLEENKIYGLLGRNGAGKSTLLNLIGCLTIRDRGDINIFGEDVFESSMVLENICIVSEKGFPGQDYKVSRIFDIAKTLYKGWDEDYKNFLVKEFRINTKKKYNSLSTGTRTLVGLIIGLASRARVTIYDEPSAGLDAAARDKFYSLLLQDYEKSKRTIIVSTHLIDEVSNLFEDVIILNDGKVLLHEDVVSLLSKAHFLNGRKENITPFIKDKKIIHDEAFGASEIIGILGVFNEEEIELMKSKSIEISPMPLQKLFIYLTDAVLDKEA